MKNGKRRLLSWIPVFTGMTILVMGAYFSIAEDEIQIDAQNLGEQGKKALIEEHYKKAFEAYSRKDFQSAIKHWTKILDLDEQQQSAKDLLRKARSEVAVENRRRENEVKRLIQSGQYAQARDEMQILSASDSSHQKRRELLENLEETASIFPQASGDAATMRLLKTAMKYYLLAPENPRLAIFCLRYASQRDARNSKLSDLLAILEEKYASESREDVPVEGMNLVEQKLESALNGIYDGKYTQAIRDCREVLILEPDNVTALKRMGSAYYALKNKKKAREAWLEAQRLSPGDKELKSFLAKTTTR